MAKIGDEKYNYSDLATKGGQLEVTRDHSSISRMANGDILAVYLNKGALTPTNPTKDEMGLYIKFDGRTFKISLETEVS